MAEKRAYNLRSGGSEAVTVPVQFEVSDENFMSRLLQCQQNTSQSGQVSDSGSENNSILSNESDNEQTHGSESTGGDKQVPSSSNTCLEINADTFSQQAINLQILSQLGDISKRLNAIENKKPKKSSDRSKIKAKLKLPGLVPQSHCLPHRLLLNPFQIYSISEVMHTFKLKLSRD